jgi:hypothetical protein
LPPHGRGLAHSAGRKILVADVPFCFSALYPIASFVIQIQVIENREPRFVIFAGVYPLYAFGCHAKAHFLKHYRHYHFAKAGNKPMANSLDVIEEATLDKQALKLSPDEYLSKVR